jgi:hypothetical protein
VLQAPQLLLKGDSNPSQLIPATFDYNFKALSHGLGRIDDRKPAKQVPLT